MDTTIKILVADDSTDCHQAIQLALAGWDAAEICAVAMNGQQMLDMIPHAMPDIAIVDIRMPVMDGYEAARQCRRLYPHIKLLALTVLDDEEAIVGMFACGVDGYIIKNADTTTLRNAILTILEGNTYICSSTGNKIPGIITRKAVAEGVTPLPEDFFKVHEKEILQMICEQLTSKQIGALLRLSERTIDKYRENLLKKTKSTNTAGLVRFAIEHGII